MGHVDHGKTTLLDTLRNAQVAAGEPGGITQHLGAFTVPHLDHKLCFLDTPGHAAFKAVREHGSLVTDLVILVLAMDDGVMPTTVEAIELSRRLHLPIIVALSKSDLFADSKGRIEKKKIIAQQLANHNVFLEGDPTHGDTQAVMVSAVNKQGIPDLMMAVLAQAELMEMMVDTGGAGSGNIVEAKRHYGQGYLASVILKKGHLKVGDWLVAGEAFGRVRSIIDQDNHHASTLLPSTPAIITGWRSGPVAGEEVVVVANEAEAKELTTMIMEDRQRALLFNNKTVMVERQNANSSFLEQYRQKLAEKNSRKLVTVADMQRRQQPADSKPQLNVIIKADVQGSVEAVKEALKSIPNTKTIINVVSADQGDLTDGDIEMARCCQNPCLILFNTECSKEMKRTLNSLGIPMVQSNIIYTLMDTVETQLKKLLPKQEAVEVLGEAVIQQLFQVHHGKSPQIVAGCMVTDRLLQTGRIPREGERFSFRILRDQRVVFEGPCKSLRHLKEEVNKATAGMECGIAFEGEPAMLVGDVVQAVRIYEQEPALI